jgi:hypothetical protein
MWQVKNRWDRGSIGLEQREQLVSKWVEGIDWDILFLVGIIFQTIFHRKSFRRWLRLSFYSFFQQEFGRGEVEGHDKTLR